MNFCFALVLRLMLILSGYLSRRINLLVFVFEGLRGIKAKPFHARTPFVLRYLPLREEGMIRTWGPGRRTPFMQRGIFSSDSWLYLLLHSNLQLSAQSPAQSFAMAISGLTFRSLTVI